MIERLVAAGAAYAVTDRDIFTTKDALDRTPEIMRKRLLIVDSDESSRMTSALMKPVFHELGIEEVLRGVSLKSATDGEGLHTAAATLYFALPDYLLACRERLHLGFPLEEIRTAIDRLLDGLQTPPARANVATLSGVFASYRATTVEGLEMRSTMMPGAADQR